MGISAGRHVSILTFTVDGVTFGLASDRVVRVELAPEITPLRGAPPFILGFVSLSGDPLPVIGFRARIGAPVAEFALSDRLIVVQIVGGMVGLLVDSVGDVASVQMAGASGITQELAPGVQGVAVDGEQIVVVRALDELITAAESDAIVLALHELTVEGRR